MPVPALLGLGTSLQSPKTIGACPFYHYKQRNDDGNNDGNDNDDDVYIPTCWRALLHSRVCIRRAMNARMVGFCDPTLASCVDALLLELKASAVPGIGRDAAALRQVQRRHGGAVDPHTLPWPPREQYLRWLRKQGRLCDDTHPREVSMHTSATVAAGPRHEADGDDANSPLVTLAAREQPQEQQQQRLPCAQPASLRPRVPLPRRHSFARRATLQTATAFAPSRNANATATATTTMHSVRAATAASDAVASVRGAEARVATARDTRRCVDVARTTAQSLIEQLQQRLHAYHTFQPYLVADATAYRGDARTRTSPATRQRTHSNSNAHDYASRSDHFATTRNGNDNNDNATHSSSGAGVGDDDDDDALAATHAAETFVAAPVTTPRFPRLCAPPQHHHHHNSSNNRDRRMGVFCALHESTAWQLIDELLDMRTARLLRHDYGDTIAALDPDAMLTSVARHGDATASSQMAASSTPATTTAAAMAMTTTTPAAATATTPHTTRSAPVPRSWQHTTAALAPRSERCFVFVHGARSDQHDTAHDHRSHYAAHDGRGHDDDDDDDDATAAEAMAAATAATQRPRQPPSQQQSQSQYSTGRRQHQHDDRGEHVIDDDASEWSQWQQRAALVRLSDKRSAHDLRRVATLLQRGVVERERRERQRYLRDLQREEATLTRVTTASRLSWSLQTRYAADARRRSVGSRRYDRRRHRRSGYDERESDSSDDSDDAGEDDECGDDACASHDAASTIVSRRRRHTQTNAGGEATAAGRAWQRRQWKAFMRGDEAVVAAAATTTTHEQSHGDDNDASALALHAWLQHGWRSHTHRHEEAAQVIACAYRCYRARVTVRRLRYARAQRLQEMRHADEEARRAWQHALRTSDAHATAAQACALAPPPPRTTTTTTTTTAARGEQDVAAAAPTADAAQLRRQRALQWLQRALRAQLLVRRARRQARAQAAHELRNYAAVCIQRVFRGYCGRLEARMRRDPALRARRAAARCARAAVCVQAWWRTRRALWRLRRVRAAVCVLQRGVRCWLARRRLRMMRAARQSSDEAALRTHAQRVLARFYRAHVTRTRRGDAALPHCVADDELPAPTTTTTTTTVLPPPDTTTTVARSVAAASSSSLCEEVTAHAVASRGVWSSITEDAALCIQDAWRRWRVMRCRAPLH